MFKRFRIRKKIALIVAVAGILFAPSQSFSLNYIPTIHVGTFRGVLDEGRISIFARTDSTAVVIFFNETFEYGGVNENITINGDGTFSFTTPQGMSFSGKFEISDVPGPQSVAGTYIDVFGFEGQFFAETVPRQGQFQNIAGYYKGSVTGSLWNHGEPLSSSASGKNYWFLSSDGTTGNYTYFVVTEDGRQAEADGYANIFNSVGPDANIGIGSGLSDASDISGSYDDESQIWIGDIFDSVSLNQQSGHWSAVLVESMPNRLPVAKNDYYNVLPGKRLVVQTPNNTVLNNDVDADNDELSTILITEPSHGVLVFARQTGSFSYTPDQEFIGKDSFSYKATDGFGDSNLATVILLVGQSLPWLPLLLE